jgi:hypothetical protein
MRWNAEVKVKCKEGVAEEERTNCDEEGVQ